MTTQTQIESVQIVAEFANRSRAEYDNTRELTPLDSGTCMTIRVPVALLNRIRDMADEFGLKVE